ncbi:MAG: hypothetical protein P4L40_02405 [Terracidiphilus sp.]|nr:hypothetical protein [Terracidiphilus sp.]
MMKRWGQVACAAAVLTVAASLAAQVPRPLVESGEVGVNGQPVPYLIRHLPPSSFPDMPQTVAAQLARRGCLIPQTYQARQPENVIHASLERPGSSDWAVLCSAEGTVALLVFFESALDSPTVLVNAPQTERLQRHIASATLGFNWGIDPASPRRIHEAQTGLARRPPAPDHDALADSVIDHRTIYHFFSKGKWTLLEMPAD